MIHRLKITVVALPEDWIRGVPPDDFFYSLRDSLFYSNGCEAEDVLEICLVLRVDVFVYFRLDFAVFDACSFIGCS